MSTVTRPKGPLPARVYWVRRTLVLVVALGLVFGVAQLLDGFGSAPPGDSARVVGAEPTDDPAVPLSTADTEPTDKGDAQAKKPAERTDGKKGKKKSREPTKTRTPLPEPSGRCDDGDILVTPEVRHPAHAGSRVHFRLELTTVTSPACNWTVSSGSVAVKLTSGEDRIWSSQDCPHAIRSTDVVVRKDHPATVDLSWRGQRSDSTCSRTTSWAQPGWYHVQAAAYGAEPTDVQFELHDAVRPTITPKPKPEKDDKKRDDKQDKKDEEGSGRG